MRYGFSSSTTCGKDLPRVRRVISRIRALSLASAFDAMRRSLPSFAMLKPRNFRSSGRATALFRLVDLHLKPVGQEPAHRSHDPLAGAVTADVDIASSSGGESHPSALTDPDMTLSRHPALTLQR